MIQIANLLQSFLPNVYLYTKTYYLQVYLDKCAYKIIDKGTIDYLGENLFVTDED